MTPNICKAIFTVLLLGIGFQQGKATRYENITTMRWGGLLAFFAVPEEKVRAKLNELEEGNSCPEVLLNVPNRSILKEFLREDQHVIGVSIGNLWASSFDETLPDEVSSRYSLRAATVQFFIPFLSGPDPDGVPHYKLALSSFVSTEKRFLQPNLALSSIHVEEIVLRKDGLTMKHGAEYFNVSWKVPKTCKTVNVVVIDDADEFIEELIVPYNYQLNFSACEDCDLREYDYCKAREELSCTLSRNRFNACEIWAQAEGAEICTLKDYSVDAISSYFQAASLLSETDQIPIFSEIHGAVDYRSDIEVPCIASV